jgi:transcription antitermination factor NusG
MVSDPEDEGDDDDDDDEDTGSTAEYESSTISSVDTDDDDDDDGTEPPTMNARSRISMNSVTGSSNSSRSTVSSLTTMALEPGQSVHIVGGTYSGQHGIVTKLTQERVAVLLWNDPKPHCLHPRNVVATMSSVKLTKAPTRNARSRITINSTTNSSRSSTVSSLTTMPLEPGQSVHIVGGTYAGQHGIVIKLTQERVAVRLSNDLKPRYLLPRNVVATTPN